MIVFPEPIPIDAGVLIIRGIPLIQADEKAYIDFFCLSVISPDLRWPLVCILDFVHVRLGYCNQSVIQIHVLGKCGTNA